MSIELYPRGSGEILAYKPPYQSKKELQQQYYPIFQQQKIVQPTQQDCNDAKKLKQILI